MRKILTLLMTLPVLAGCAYAVDTQNQEITILTPGAEGAICYVYVEGLKYKIHPPEKTIIFRSRQDMRVECLAPGNRRQEMVVQSKTTQSAYYNVLNAGVGAVFDHASGALYTYPDIIEVSFVGVPIQPFPGPSQNHPDIKQPEEYQLEEFLPSAPRLNSDLNKVPNEIQRRQRGGSFKSNTSDYNSFSESPARSGKENLRDAEASSSPQSLYPGQ